MDIITLDEFIADIETTFKNYTASGDIDRQSIKTWVIECLRKFGKNICDTRETIVNISNSKGLLPETFRSMNLALKITGEGVLEEKDNRRLIVEKQKIENPAQWSNITHDYHVNYCSSKILTEKIYTYYEHEDKCYNYTWLSLVDGIKGDAISDNCLNMHPTIRNTFPDKISITSRSVNTNFPNGKIYFQYSALPSSDNGEVAIPILSTGDILSYVTNIVKQRIAEELIINDKNPQTLSSLYGAWLQQDRQLYILAKSEASWKGLKKGWQKRMYEKNRFNENLYKLPS